MQFRIGQRIEEVNTGQRGMIVYPFAVPSSAGNGIDNPVTVKFAGMRTPCVVSAHRLMEGE